jgi:enoyl-CoA hydratase/carnithine racemase
MSARVIAQVSDSVAIATLNRPEKLNAIDYAMAETLLALLNDWETDDRVRAVILTGAGERAFSAGADIRQFSESVRHGEAVALRDFVRRGQAMTARIESFSKPVIAAVNGLAFGGGCEIVEAAHLAIASEQALFAKPEIKLGMPPTFGGTQRLPRLAGRKRALRLLLTGETFSASDASTIGLVNEVVPHARLIPRAHELAREIAAYSPLAVTAIIRAGSRGLDMTIGEGLHTEGEQFAKLVHTQDLREGLDAWIERREPRFTGR